jgi:hypothetical protein
MWYHLHMEGLCECGCGQRTPIARITRTERGQVKGQPLRFINGHNRRKSPVEYVVADRGYETPCWVWQRSLDSKGYGRVGGAYNNGHSYAHIMIYERHRGPVPAGLELDHLCRVPACVNPAHLDPVTHAENLRRGSIGKITTPVGLLIKARYAAGERVLDLAAEYRCSNVTIYNVLKR